MGDGNYVIVSQLGKGESLYVIQPSENKPGSRLVYKKFSGEECQKFYFKRQNDGSYLIVHRDTELVCDVSGGSNDNSAEIILWPLHGGPNQRFIMNSITED